MSSATLSVVAALPTANVTVRSAAAPSGKMSRSVSCVTSTVTVSAAVVDPVRLSVKSAAPASSRTTFLSFAIVTTGVISALVRTASEGSDQSLGVSPLSARTCTW